MSSQNKNKTQKNRYVPKEIMKSEKRARLAQIFGI